MHFIKSIFSHFKTSLVFFYSEMKMFSNPAAFGINTNMLIKSLEEMIRLVKGRSKKDRKFIFQIEIFLHDWDINSSLSLILIDCETERHVLIYQ